MGLLFRLGVLPMNLFAGVFYPISRLPEWLQVVAQVIPLTHGVAILRALSLGTGTRAGACSSTPSTWPPGPRWAPPSACAPSAGGSCNDGRVAPTSPCR